MRQMYAALLAHTIFHHVCVIRRQLYCLAERRLRTHEAESELHNKYQQPPGRKILHRYREPGVFLYQCEMWVYMLELINKLAFVLE